MTILKLKEQEKNKKSTFYHAIITILQTWIDDVDMLNDALWLLDVAGVWTQFSIELFLYGDVEFIFMDSFLLLRFFVFLTSTGGAADVRSVRAEKNLLSRSAYWAPEMTKIKLYIFELVLAFCWFSIKNKMAFPNSRNQNQLSKYRYSIMSLHTGRF